MKITRKSQQTGEYHTLDLSVTPEQMIAFKGSKKLIQNVFPDLAAPYREFLKSGITPSEWKEMFGDRTGANQKCIDEQVAIFKNSLPTDELSDMDEDEDEADHFGMAPELPTQDDEPRNHAEDDSDY